MEHDFADDKRPIGSIGDWIIKVREDANPGLHLGGVKAGWNEFCGRN